MKIDEITTGFSISFLIGQPDRNGRIWPKEVVERAVEKAMNQEEGLPVRLVTDQADLDIVGSVVSYNSEEGTAEVKLERSCFSADSNLAFSLRENS